MPGYYLHFAACGGQSLKNRSFVLGVETPDILKKHLKTCGGVDGARTKYESIRTTDMPDYDELQVRVQQKERRGSTDGLHYGVSSSPDIKAFWNGLSKEQKSNPFYRGYAWHLLTDAIMYARLKIDDKFQKFVEENQGKPNIEELKEGEIKKLHIDWDKTNAWVRDAYPEVFLPDEVKELGVVQFIDEGNLVYVDWRVLKSTIEYLRAFDPLKGDMDAIIKTVLNSIEFEGEQRTCCGDVVELFSYKGNVGEHSFSLCKTLMLEDTDRGNSDNWIYMIILKGDRYPIIITEECANSILENPKKGKDLVYSRWFDRYR